MNQSTDLYFFVGLPRGNVSGLCHVSFESYDFIIVMSINFFSAMLLTLSSWILTLNERKGVKISLDCHAKDGWKRRTRPSWFLYSDTTRYSANQKPAYIYVILCVFETAGTDCDIVYYLFIAMSSIHVLMINLSVTSRFSGFSHFLYHINLP
jgi:hypothetical protein